MEYLFIYLLQMVEFLETPIFFGEFFFILFIVSFVVIRIITEVVKNDEYIDDDEKNLFVNISELLKKGTIITGIFAFLLSIIPTKQTLLLMGGTYMAKKTVSSIATDSRMSKVNAIIDLQLDKCLKDLKQEVK